MKTPHVHAALIKAWADGAVIQLRQKGTTFQWVDCYNNNPHWRDEYEYRIKPEKKTYWIYVTSSPTTGIIHNSAFFSNRGTAERQRMEYLLHSPSWKDMGIHSITIEE